MKLSAVALAFVTIFGAVNRDTVWTAVTLAVATLVAIATVKTVSRWVLRTLRDDLQEAIRAIVRDELSRHPPAAGPPSAQPPTATHPPTAPEEGRG